MTVFMNVTNYYDVFYSSWMRAASNAENMKFYVSSLYDPGNDMENMTTSYSYNLNENNDQCKSIQERLVEYKVNVCKWAGSVSVMSFVMMVMGILGIVYALMRVNYVRHSVYLRNNNGKSSDLYTDGCPTDQRAFVAIKS